MIPRGDRNELMATRIAGTLSLVSFAVCLIAGLTCADNGFGTIVWRALTAMGGTFVLGLVIGWMGQKMLEENLRQEAGRLEEARQKQLQAYRDREPILEVGSDGPVGPGTGRGVARGATQG